MLIPGYTEIFRKDDVIVFDLKHTSLPSQLVMSNHLNGVESYHLPLDPLRSPFESEDDEGYRRRGRRRRRRRKSIKKDYIVLKLNEELVELEGFVYARTYSKLTQFLVTHMVPQANEGEDFEKWLFQNQHREITSELLNEAESHLIKAVEYRCEYARKDLDNLYHHEIQNQPWYFEEHTYHPCFVDQTEVIIEGYSVPRVHFLTVERNKSIAFDGKYTHFVDHESREGPPYPKPLENAKAYESGSLEPLALSHVEAVACLRIPTLEEYQQSGLQDLEDPPAIPGTLPAYGYLYDSQMPVPIENPKKIKMIDQIEEVIALLACTEHGVLLGDRTPEFPSSLIFKDTPSFMLLTLPRGCDAL